MAEQLELDCYHKAEEGEPRFTLLGRDHAAPSLVRLWAACREADYKEMAFQFSQLMSVSEQFYENNPTNDSKLQSACSIAEAMEKWD